MNGNTVPVAGTVSFDFSRGHSDYVCDAVIFPNFSYNVVLRRDFLHKNRAVIKVGKETVTFSKSSMVIFASGDSPPVLSEVRAAKTFVIDSNSEVVIPAILTSFSSEPVIGLLKGVSQLSDRYYLLCASTLCQRDADGSVTLYLLNPSAEPVLIHNGTTVGKFEETLQSLSLNLLQVQPQTTILMLLIICLVPICLLLKMKSWKRCLVIILIFSPSPV